MNPFYRVDNRLVHGQIISTWLPHLRLDRFLVVCDAVAHNEMQCAMFRMAMPGSVQCEALTAEDAVPWLNEKRFGDDKTMVLMESVQDAVRLFDGGHPFSTLNIGNVHHGPGSRAITNAVYLDEDQLTALRRLVSRGVQVEVRSLPMEAPVDLAHVGR